MNMRGRKKSMRRILAILAVCFLLLTVVSVAQASANQPPVADPNGPYTGMATVPLTFDGSGSSDPDGDPISYYWDFGDANTGTGVTPIHTYVAGGVYTVTLTVTDSHGLSDTQTTTATISFHPPVASFTESAHTAPVGTPITFDPSGSYDPDGTIILYEWDFDGDGVYDLSTTTPSIVSYTYTTPGTYTVTLRITDHDGFMDTATDEKIITPEDGFVIPEVPLGTIMASAAMIIALVAYVALPKWRRKQTSINS